jgi:RimJ/RimL family protein N-acetyltransferase
MVSSKNIKLVLVEEKDAQDILDLRNNGKLNMYISTTDINVEKQKEWIREYKKREKNGEEYYFAIQKHDGDILGYVRVYDINEKNKSFTWGSWIMKEDKPVSSALETAILIYEFAFSNLNMEKSLFEVMKDNGKVISFHKKFGAKKISEDKEFEYFILEKESYFLIRDKKYKKYLKEE